MRLHVLQASSSQWQDFVQTLPDTTNSPTLWSAEEQSELLQGSPALAEAQSRSKALDDEWQTISQYMATSTAFSQSKHDAACHRGCLLQWGGALQPLYSMSWLKTLVETVHSWQCCSA